MYLSIYLCIQDSVTFRHVAFEICKRTNRQTHTHRQWSQYLLATTYTTEERRQAACCSAPFPSLQPVCNAWHERCHACGYLPTDRNRLLFVTSVWTICRVWLCRCALSRVKPKQSAADWTTATHCRRHSAWPSSPISHLLFHVHAPYVLRQHHPQMRSLHQTLCLFHDLLSHSLLQTFTA